MSTCKSGSTMISYTPAVYGEIEQGETDDADESYDCSGSYDDDESDIEYQKLLLQPQINSSFPSNRTGAHSLSDKN